ncbi:hypothetical protein AB1Y20_006055 [Prymnesium parvum]|uniref:PX domain-containing protein n=1 Tax=Prymnesium parvum TaxID=97485 RepID=A0AB34J255_PRYPA
MAAPLLLSHVSTEVRLPRPPHTGFDVFVGSRSDASKSFILRRHFEDFERLHARIGRPKKLNFPKKSGGTPGEQREQLTIYLRAVLSDQSLRHVEDEVGQFLELALLEQFLGKLNELEQFNNLNVQLKDDELRRTRNDLVEARARLDDARVHLKMAGMSPSPSRENTGPIEHCDSESLSPAAIIVSPEAPTPTPTESSVNIEAILEDVASVRLQGGELGEKVDRLVGELRASQVRVGDAEGRAADAARQLLGAEKELAISLDRVARAEARAATAEAQLLAEGQAAARELEAKLLAEGLRSELEQARAKLAEASASATDKTVVEQAAAAAVEAVTLREAAERRAAMCADELAAMADRIMQVDARAAQAEEALASAKEEAKAEYGAIEKKLREVEAERGAMEKKLRESEAKRGSMEARLRETEVERGAIEARLREAEAERGAMETRLREAEAERGAMETRLREAEAERGAMETRLREAEADRVLATAEEAKLRDALAAHSLIEAQLSAAEGRLAQGEHQRLALERELSLANEGVARAAAAQAEISAQANAVAREVDAGKLIEKTLQAELEEAKAKAQERETALLEGKAVAEKRAAEADARLAQAVAEVAALTKIASQSEAQAPTSIAALLPSPREAIRSLDVSVTSATLAPGGWWVFHVSVSCAGLRYTLLRRYREFYALHTNLSAGGGKPPAFPRKYSTRSQTETFAEKRRQELNAYLDRLASDQTRLRPEFHAFLELGLLLSGRGE